MEDVYHRMPDGTMIYGKSWMSGKDTGVLVLPNIGETLLKSYYDSLCGHIAKKADVHVLELRGHKLSQGEWSLHSYRADIAYWISHFRQKYKHFYVIASGFSASTMLEYDDQAHTFRVDRPPLPDGMVLVNPVFEGTDILPEHGRAHKLARSVFGKHAVSRKLKPLQVRFVDPVLFWEEMEEYNFSPVRIQTPTVVFVATDELSEPLQRIFGSVNIRRIGWMHHGTSLGMAKHLKDIEHAVETVMTGEKPHRFRTAK